MQRAPPAAAKANKQISKEDQFFFLKQRVHTFITRSMYRYVSGTSLSCVCFRAQEDTGTSTKDTEDIPVISLD